MTIEFPHIVFLSFSNDSEGLSHEGWEPKQENSSEVFQCGISTNLYHCPFT